MNLAFDIHAPKKATNVSINTDLLAKAKALKINLSATLESSLAAAVAAKEQELWQLENKAAIAAYNQQVDEQGVFSDGLRSF